MKNNKCIFHDKITDFLSRRKKQSDSISRLDIIATVFDKNGKLNPKYKAGPCLFPYFYGNQKLRIG